MNTFDEGSTKMAASSYTPKSVLLVLETAGEGGTEIYVDNLAQYLSANRHCEIVTLDGNADAAQHRFPNFQSTTVRNLREIWNLLRSRPESIVNLHVYTSMLPVAIAAKSLGRKVVTTLHLPLSHWNLRHRKAWQLAVGISDGIVGVSDACFAGFGPFLSRHRPIVAPAPIDLILPSHRINPNRRIRLQAVEVLCTARLEKQKDISTLIRAMGQVENAKLTILGDGSERSELERLGRGLNIDVEFVGNVSRSEAIVRLKGADIFVLPSRFEGLGIAAVEAMAMGVPTIVANFPASSEYIVSEQTGLTFPIGDVDALAGSIKRLIEDPVLCERLAHSGSNYVVKKFSTETQFGKYETIFSKYDRQQNCV
jgi:glycosyltransferase involved in cell wall biosynthesis